MAFRLSSDMGSKHALRNPRRRLLLVALRITALRTTIPPLLLRAPKWAALGTTLWRRHWQVCLSQVLSCVLSKPERLRQARASSS
jgi:hypothetical protein